MKKHIDAGSLVIALITLVLFVAALFSKGISHDLFLEAGVFLVSVKIIIMAYKNSVAVAEMNHKLDAILQQLPSCQTAPPRNTEAAGAHSAGSKPAVVTSGT
jgi:hypothetical protein